MLLRFWKEEAASVQTAEIVLLMTVLAIGVIAGLKSFRDSTVTEFADMAQALANLNQSYAVPAATVGNLTTAASSYVDTADFCDGPNDVNVGPRGPRCVTVCLTPVAEGQ